MAISLCLLVLGVIYVNLVTSKAAISSFSTDRSKLFLLALPTSPLGGHGTGPSREGWLTELKFICTPRNAPDPADSQPWLLHPPPAFPGSLLRLA